MPMTVANEIVDGRLVDHRFNSRSVVHSEFDGSVEDLQRQELQNAHRQQDRLFGSRLHFKLKAEGGAHL